MALRCPLPPFSTSVGIKVMFILVSFFVILLVKVYRDNVGGFNLLLLQDHKQGVPLSGSCLHPPPQPRPNLQLTITNTTSRTKVIPEKRGGAAVEGTQKDGEKTRGDKEKRRGCTCTDDTEQEERKQRIMDVCSGKDTVEFPGRTWAFEQIPIRDLKYLIVDDKHQIIYCYVPKVGCTNWMKVMVVLTQSLISPSTGKPYTDPAAIPSELVHNNSLFLTLNKFKHRYGFLYRHLMALKLQHYTKFMFVRDPFVRLISAFRDKFQRPNTNVYKKYAETLLHHYGNASGSLPENVAKAHEAGIKPTFQQFISYVVDPETEKQSAFNQHWRQVYQLCHPCQIKYDFIGHLETLESDVDKLLKVLKVDHLVHYPSGPQNQTAASWERKWFAQIPLTMRRKLYKLYEADFKLFGYPIPDSIFN